MAKKSKKPRKFDAVKGGQVPSQEWGASCFVTFESLPKQYAEYERLDKCKFHRNRKLTQTSNLFGTYLLHMNASIYYVGTIYIEQYC